MKITVYNFKGGVGKTCIALNIALTMDYAIVTNDILSPLDEILEDGQIKKLKLNEKVPTYPEDWDLIFDLGGYLDSRAKMLLKQSDCVVVPVVNEYIDVHTTVNFIQEIEQYNNKIVIVANKTGKNDFAHVKKTMAKNYPKYPVLEIKNSRALPNLMIKKKSVKEMMKESRLLNHHYKAIEEQFDKLISTIRGIK